MKRQDFKTIILILVAGIVLNIIVKLVFRDTTVVEIKDASKFAQTISLIRDKYVDNIDIDSLLDVIAPDIMTHLDPHSEYIPPKDMDAINEHITGHFDGIGVVFNMATDTATVLSTVTGGPGYKAGVLAGDRIVTVNDTVIAGVRMNQDSVVMRLRGRRGTEVVLGIQRGDNRELVDFSLVRDVIPINSVDAKFLTDSKSGYIRINTFAQNTYYDVINALDQQVRYGATSAIIDLRGNGGGLLDQALMLANEFLEAGQTIVYIEGEHVSRIDQPATGSGAFKDLPLYVLIDETSASASEIFAGAMQDNDRAVIVGRRSFGKGLVQEQIPYGDGSAMRLTVARYYTPLGRPVQKPYTAGDSETYDSELRQRYDSKELTSGHSTQIDSTVEYRTPSGRVLYGGGGIYPDVFVPIDTTKLPRYFLETYYTNSMFMFARDFADRHRQKINSIETFQELTSFLDSQPLLYEKFIDYATKHHKVKRPSAAQREAARRLITDQLRAFIGRNTSLQESAYYYYMQDQDPVMQKINSLIKQNQR